MPGSLPDPTRKDRHKLVNSFLTTASKFQGSRESSNYFPIPFMFLGYWYGHGTVSGLGEAVDWCKFSSQSSFPTCLRCSRMDCESYSRHHVSWGSVNSQLSMALGPSVGRLSSVVWCHFFLVESPVGSLVCFGQCVICQKRQSQRTVLLPWVSITDLERTQELGTQIRKDWEEVFHSSFSVPLFRAVPSPNPAWQDPQAALRRCGGRAYGGASDSAQSRALAQPAATRAWPKPQQNEIARPFIREKWR